MTIVVATANPGKLSEIRAILADLPLELVGLDAVPEVVLPVEGEAYEPNARAKALAVAEQAGLPALADDSGLEVAALAGGPGPRSSRYGGAGLDDAGRVAHLLAELAGARGAERSARFVCVAALAVPGRAVVTTRGECAGRIRETAVGAGGFGYDPVFEPAAARTPGRSMAELPADQKNRISHRANAFRALRQALLELASGGREPC